jgi:iron uptake system component EfeO
MNRIPVRPTLIAAGIGLSALVAGGCSSSDEAPAGARKMSFKLTDAGCEPHTAKAPAGPIVFDVENAGTSKVNEFEVLDGDTILGEVENLSDGLTGTFSLSLEQGKYTLYCPGGFDERGTLTVSGQLQAKGGPQVEAAVSDYRAYLEKNMGELVATTEPFVEAVAAGDVEQAKQLYAAARVPYERIEPVADYLLLVV